MVTTKLASIRAWARGLVLEFDPCYRVRGKPAYIDQFTLIVGQEAFRLPIDGFRMGDPSRSCPSAGGAAGQT